jgi:hypothetical protein
MKHMPRRWHLRWNSVFILRKHNWTLHVPVELCYGHPQEAKNIWWEHMINRDVHLVYLHQIVLV